MCWAYSPLYDARHLFFLKKARLTSSNLLTLGKPKMNFLLPSLNRSFLR